MRWPRVISAALVALLLAASAFYVRRQFIPTWFVDAPPGAPPLLPQAGTEATGFAPVPLTRVLLIDGLGAELAKELPTLSRFCGDGLDLTVDVGFPTVSLPVQAAFWTGKTQQQLGLLYRIAGLETPLPEAAPARLPGSVAVVEDQPAIAKSFGFENLLSATKSVDRWINGGFAEAAVRVLANDAPLAFVHVLRVDKAGHKSGPGSPAYKEAALWADDLLGKLLAAAPVRADQRWFVFSDHGHRPRGGHAGLEPGVRLVRACVAGGPVNIVGPGAIHLVDLSRALFDSVGLVPNPDALGRPVRFALREPAPGATVPRPAWGWAYAAGSLSLLVAIAFVWLTRSRPEARAVVRSALVAWAWLPLAYAGIVLIHGAPSLSTAAIYPPLGRDLLIAASAGLGALALWAAWSAARTAAPNQIFWNVLALAPAVIGAVSALIACGGVRALLDRAPGPPLRESATAHASILLVLLAGAALVVAVVGAVGTAVRMRRRSSLPAP
jgi:Type I phosphodiesterase / nucleotide pyrophosphatase